MAARAGTLRPSAGINQTEETSPTPTKQPDWFTVPHTAFDPYGRRPHGTFVVQRHDYLRIIGLVTVALRRGQA